MELSDRHLKIRLAFEFFFRFGKSGNLIWLWFWWDCVAKVTGIKQISGPKLIDQWIVWSIPLSVESIVILCILRWGACELIVRMFSTLNSAPRSSLSVPLSALRQRTPCGQSSLPWSDSNSVRLLRSGEREDPRAIMMILRCRSLECLTLIVLSLLIVFQHQLEPCAPPPPPPKKICLLYSKD